jgi:hypothetical protein
MQKTSLFSLTVSTVLSVLACCIFDPIVVTPVSATREAGPQVVGQSAIVIQTLQTSFGTTVKAVTAFRPFYLTGDFNGDKVQDLAVVVRVMDRRAALPKDVQVLNPFWESPKVTYPANPAKDNTHAIVILHSWNAPRPDSKYLLIGPNPMLVFVPEHASNPDNAKDLIRVVRKGAKRSKDDEIPAAAKGDVILAGNQVGSECAIFWNGKTYRFFEPEGD